MKSLKFKVASFIRFPFCEVAKFFFVLLLLSFQSQTSFSQEEYSTKSKKAIKLFQSAMQKYDSRLDTEAIAELDNAIAIDNKFIEAYILKANIYHDNKKYLEEINEYNRAINIDSAFSPKTYLFVAEAELNIGMYKESKDHLTYFLTLDKIKASLKAQAEDKLSRAEYGYKSSLHPVDFKPVNLGSNINSEYDEYWPSLTADEEFMFITRQIPSNPNERVTHTGMQEDFYISKKNYYDWTLAKNMGKPINTPNNEGALCISPDGMYVFYTVCNRPEDFGSCDIYYSKIIGDIWTVPQNVGTPVNSEYWESNPSFSSDGKTLYYVSNRPGGNGLMDIWSAEIVNVSPMGKISWSVPQNLSDTINTINNEIAPFIHPDNSTLYFSSDGHVGMGGLDIFYTKRDSLGNWSATQNVGFPINTFSDERGLIVNAQGNYAYFASNRDSKNGLDIYGFELYENARPTLVTYVKGFIYDSLSKERLHAKFELMDLETSETLISSNSNEINGEYLVCLPINKNYAFNASKDGYMFYSENFSLKDMTDPSKPYTLNIPLLPIKEDVKIVLKNIFYETNKYQLKPESKAELTKLLEFMNKNSKVKIEISGHTDNIGNQAYNQSLSENRAKTVYEYLLENNIPKERVSYKGYNFSEPIASNNTEEGRAQNRRTEFKIISIE
ncbi:MAG TPA: hypothetical protein DDX39_00820 [Bacteroidales bacterium]|nr:hypothetical protein [Bacteroidales bacterium]